MDYAKFLDTIAQASDNITPDNYQESVDVILHVLNQILYRIEEIEMVMNAAL